MIQNTSYRLGDYKIIDDEHGDLWWESHVGFGSLTTGKCFIIDDILFIKPSQIYKPGFLKGEFVDNLKKLKKWNKTKYYCTSYRLCRCESRKIALTVTHKSQDDEVNKTMMEECNNNEIDNVSSKSGEMSYKLSRYQIVDRKDGPLLWKTFNGLGGVNYGKCKIAGNILFIGPRETDVPGLTKRQFMRQLTHLAKWDKTQYYCPKYTIYNTQTGHQGFETIEKKNLKVNVDKSKDANIKPIKIFSQTNARYEKNVLKKDYLILFLAVSFLSVRLILNFVRKFFQDAYKLVKILLPKRGLNFWFVRRIKTNMRQKRNSTHGDKNEKT